MEKLKFIDFFSGIGGFHSGFEKAGMECVGWCEFDKFAQQSYRAMYETEGLWFGDDVRKARGWELPRAAIWTFGFPCQDISIAGNQRGIKRGTRSGLFFEIMRLIDEAEENRPEFLVAENVKNLLSIGGGYGFLSVLSEMADRGYSVEWGMYNSKNYGVPQNRERVYLIGHYGGTGGRKVLPIPRQGGQTLKQIGNLIETESYGGNPQRGRAYQSDGICPTLTTMQGGGLEPKVAIIDLSYNKPKITTNTRCLVSRYTAGITNHAGVNSGLLIKNATKQGYQEALPGDGVNLAFPDSKTRRGRVQEHGASTLQCNDSQGAITSDCIIRKLTPLECFRLQGFTDEQFYKAQSVNSNSQLYKQAGNAVTVNVTYEIGKSIVEWLTTNR